MQRVNEATVGAGVWCIQAKLVLERRLYQTGVDHGVVEAGWRIIQPQFVLRLLMHAAAVEDRKQAGEFQG
ncbi:hypothetical protein D3C71_2219220 [compost metagenome]